jgi:hypothetical protein
MKKSVIVVSLISLCLGAVSGPVAASPVLFAKKFSNCTELNKVYPGGVAAAKSVKNQGGKTKKTPTVNAKVYAENSGKDRDKDGIACEK